uniref:Acetyl-coenzyme A synthetase n=1 Tax=Tanacetum cinerariifolium TaxID=118510 RepID=A0A699IEU7_TANCI|nr:acetyl-coenzyme A synthetase [Tanacetum cinerariifolium]
MRVLFCKIHCPSFICFCKPSTASHLYTSGSLKLENCTQVPGPLVVNDPLDQNHGVVEEIVEVKEKDVLEDGEKESVVESVVLRSCMKNKGDSQKSVIDGKKVQWMDDLGKELVDIKEFESSETGDTYNEDDNNACFCTIL